MKLFAISRGARRLAALLAPPWLLCLAATLTGAQASPELVVEDEVVAFAYAPDGRIAYAVRRILTRNFMREKIELQRDDIWMLWPDGERKRIVNGEKLVKSATPYSYAIQSLRWAPDGTKLTVEMLTSVVIDERLNTRDGVLSLLIDSTGKEINIAGGQSVIEGATNAAWLPDGVSVAYQTEEVKPNLLFSLGLVRPVAGRGGRLMENATFAAVAWNLKPGAPLSAVAVERDRSLSGPSRLVWLDLVKETRRELAVLDSYFGQLCLSPSGTKVAYYIDPQTLEIRDVEHPVQIARLALALGQFVWSPDERRILLKRPLTGSKKTGTLAWVTLPPLQPHTGPGAPKPIEALPRPILAGLSFREFGISPDGRHIAVTEPGQRNLQIFSVD
jgi:hypothetical protein